MSEGYMKVKWPDGHVSDVPENYGLRLIAHGEAEAADAGEAEAEAKAEAEAEAKAEAKAEETEKVPKKKIRAKSGK